jgi:hypothetical protein
MLVRGARLLVVPRSTNSKRIFYLPQLPAHAINHVVSVGSYQALRAAAVAAPPADAAHRCMRRRAN